MLQLQTLRNYALWMSTSFRIMHIVRIHMHEGCTLKQSINSAIDCTNNDNTKQLNGLVYYHYKHLPKNAASPMYE